MGPISDRMEYSSSGSSFEEDGKESGESSSKNTIDEPCLISILALPTKSELKNVIKNISPQTAFNEDSKTFEELTNAYTENIRDIYYDSPSPTMEEKFANSPTTIHVDEPNPTPPRIVIKLFYFFLSFQFVIIFFFAV